MSTQTINLNRLLELEAHSALKYVVDEAWPSVIDDGDQADFDVIKEAWAPEAPLLSEIAEEIEESGGSAQIHVAAPMRLARLNYARPSTLVSVLGNLISLELEELDELAAEAAGEDATLAFIARTSDLKKAGFAVIEAAADKATQRLAAEAAGEEVVVEKTKDAGELEFPWKDADMPLADRMVKAKDGSLFDKLFAAMAQTDCTACGYDCEGYAKAIADGEDADLEKCVPGEDDTANMLKKLMG